MQKLAKTEPNRPMLTPSGQEVDRPAISNLKSQMLSQRVLRLQNSQITFVLDWAALGFQNPRVMSVSVPQRESLEDIRA